MLAPLASRLAAFDKVAVLCALLYPAALTYVYFMLLAEAPARWQQLAYSLGKLVQFALPALCVLQGRQERLVLARPKLNDLLIGAALGAGMVAAMIIAYSAWLAPRGVLEAALPEIRRKVSGMGVAGKPQFLLLGGFYALFHSFLEEYYWRWFVFDRLRGWIGSKAAVAVSAVGFMAHHVIVVSLYFGWFSGASLVFCLGVCMGGVIWARLYEARRSLFGPWVSHLLVDAVIFGIGFHLLRHTL
jgi:hypothetical protein